MKLQEVKSHCRSGKGSTMTYRIEVKRESKYVLLSVTGVLDIFAARICRDTLNEVLLAYKQSMALVDMTRVAAKLSVIEDYEFSKELRHSLPSGVVIALIVPEVWTIDGRFIEQVAVNNGVRLRSFADKCDALVWLMRQN